MRFDVNHKLLSRRLLFYFKCRLQHLVATVMQHYLVIVEIMQWHCWDLDIMCILLCLLY